MTAVCTKCGKCFDTTTEEAESPNCLCTDCYKASKAALSLLPPDHIVDSNNMITAPSEEDTDDLTAWWGEHGYLTESEAADIFSEIVALRNQVARDKSTFELQEAIIEEKDKTIAALRAELAETKANLEAAREFQDAAEAKVAALIQNREAEALGLERINKAILG